MEELDLGDVGAGWGEEDLGGIGGGGEGEGERACGGACCWGLLGAWLGARGRGWRQSTGAAVPLGLPRRAVVCSSGELVPPPGSDVCVLAAEGEEGFADMEGGEEGGEGGWEMEVRSCTWQCLGWGSAMFEIACMLPGQPARLLRHTHTASPPPCAQPCSPALLILASLPLPCPPSGPGDPR